MSGRWVNATTFVATFDVRDANVVIPGIAVAVTGARDLAGNTSAVQELAFTLDTRAPDAPVAVSLTDASDSGASNTDEITNLSTVTVEGTAEASALLPSSRR